MCSGVCFDSMIMVTTTDLTPATCGAAHFCALSVSETEVGSSCDGGVWFRADGRVLR